MSREEETQAELQVSGESVYFSTKEAFLSHQDIRGFLEETEQEACFVRVSSDIHIGSRHWSRCLFLVSKSVW